MDDNLNYEEFKKSKDPWAYIEKQVVELTAKSMNMFEVFFCGYNFYLGKTD